MTQSVYIASIQPRSGKSLVALGLMEMVSRRVDRVGFFRPVVGTCASRDRELTLMRERYGLAAAAATCAMTYDEARVLAGNDRGDEMLERMLGCYKELEAQCDFVVCEGTDYGGAAAAFEFEFNARVADHLGAPVVFVAGAGGREPEALLDDVVAARRAFVREGCTVVATFANRVAVDRLDEVRACFARAWTHDDPVFAIPDEPLLGHPTLADLMTALDGELLYGDEQHLQALAADFAIAAMELPALLERLRSGTLVIAGGDRTDVLLGCLASVRSEAFPDIAGMVLTGGLDLPPAAARLVEGLRRPEVPMIRVKTDTYATAAAIAAVQGAITADDARKIASALGLFERHVDVTALEDRIRVSRSENITPARFEYELIARAKQRRRHIVLPEGTDERILRAADILRRRDVVDLTLLGKPAEVRELASSLGVGLEGMAIVDPLESPWRAAFAERYHALRRHKGVNEDMALDRIGDVSYFGTMMVHEGLADGMVSGAAHTTAHTIRPALEFIRARPGVSVVSSVFLMCLRDRVLVYGDCAVNQNPSPTELADIAISSAETAALFGIEPLVAMLSYSTGGSGGGQDVERVREATRLVRARRPDIAVEGPIQYDAAVDAGVARQKLPGSPVAGRATVFVFPDLNTGNNTYKAVQRSAGAVAIGPILQGLNKPVNDLSRGCTVTDIVNTVAVTAIQA